jgi:hypothetical protein
MSEEKKPSIMIATPMYGGKIYANPFIKLEHVGTYVYGGDIIKSGGNLK